MTVLIIVSAFSLAAFMASFACLIFTIRTAIELHSMQKSTHSVQMVPVDQLGQPVRLDDPDSDDFGFQSLTKEQRERMTRDELEPIQ